MLVLVLGLTVPFVGIASIASAQDDSVGNEPSEDETIPTENNAAEAVPISPPTAPAGELRLIGQSPYVAADGNFVVRLGWDGPLDPDLIVSTTIHGKLSRESQLGTDSTVLNRPPSSPLITLRQQDGELVVDLPIRSFTRAEAPAGQDRILIPDPGVYPVDIEVRDGVGPVASVQTFLVRLPTETAEIDLLPVSLILPVSSADGLSITDAIVLLERHPTLPITVLLETGVVSELQNGPEEADRLARALGERALIVGPTLDLDPSALVEIGQGQLYSQALASTRSQLADLGLDPSPTTIPLESSVTVEGAELLRSLEITTVLEASTAASGVIGTDAGELRIAAIDQELTSLLSARTNSVAAAHLLIARLALRSETDRTPVLLGGPLLRQASVESIEVLLNASEMVGLLEQIPLNELSGRSPGLTIRPAENPEQDLRPVAELITQTVTDIDTYRSFYDSGSTRPSELSDTLLAALGRDRNPTDRLRAIELVGERLASTFDVITIREGQSMTLTARELTVPLSIENTSLGDRAVILRFTGDKVAVAEDGQVFILSPGITTLDITVEARALGLSPLEVEAVTPDGRRLLSASRLQIRSTAIPGLGILLSGAAFVFLVSWWIISIGRARALKHQAGQEDRAREERANGQVAHDPTAAGDPIDEDAEQPAPAT